MLILAMSNVLCLGRVSMSGQIGKGAAITSLLHECITASSTYVRGCEEDIVIKLRTAIKVLSLCRMRL